MMMVNSHTHEREKVPVAPDVVSEDHYLDYQSNHFNDVCPINLFCDVDTILVTLEFQIVVLQVFYLSQAYKMINSRNNELV